jgi:protein OS-9
MTTTDSILFVKETKTCSYVLVINTPRLCGEPGFKSRRDAAEEAEIHCREIVDILPQEPLNFPVADYPIKGSRPRKPHLPAVEFFDKATDSTEDSKSEGNIEPDQRQENIVNDLLRQSIETLLEQRRGGKAITPEEPTELVIELLDDDEQEEIGDKLVSALRAAGYDVRGAEYLGLKDVFKEGKDKGDDRKRRVKKSMDDDDDYARDEL